MELTASATVDIEAHPDEDINSCRTALQCPVISNTHCNDAEEPFVSLINLDTTQFRTCVDACSTKPLEDTCVTQKNENCDTVCKIHEKDSEKEAPVNLIVSQVPNSRRSTDSSIDVKYMTVVFSGHVRTSSDASQLGVASCRICQCGAEEEVLINPCRCSGSVKWMHESCLVHWMKTSMKDYCELCRTQIEIKRKKKAFWKWKLPSQRPTPVLWVLVFITAIALNLASVIKDASKLCTSTPCLVFYAVGCVGVVLGTLFLIYWSKRARVFIGHWIEQNEDWHIALPTSSNGNIWKSKSTKTVKDAESAVTEQLQIEMA